MPDSFGVPVKSDTERAKVYCSALDDIRARLDVVDAICRNQITTGAENFDYEIAAINLRKALEHIAFGSLMANRSVYEPFHKDIQKIWRAKQLLERLEKINPHFYPQPLEQPTIAQEPKAPRHFHFENLTTGFLTRSEFVVLYDSCSEVIHSQNPFSGKSTINFGLPPLEWAERVRRLLSFHFFRLYGFPQLWLGELQGPDGKAHVYIASAS